MSFVKKKLDIHKFQINGVNFRQNMKVLQNYSTSHFMNILSVFESRHMCDLKIEVCTNFVPTAVRCYTCSSLLIQF